MRRQYLSRFQCGHDGCGEAQTYESTTRADQADQYRRYGNGKWRCVRHIRPDEVLSLTNRTRTDETVSERRFSDSGRDIGLYFGHFGSVSGPGFKAFARDFPEGTILRVTAEIIPPTIEPPPGFEDWK